MQPAKCMTCIGSTTPDCPARRQRLRYEIVRSANATRPQLPASPLGCLALHQTVTVSFLIAAGPQTCMVVSEHAEWLQGGRVFTRAYPPI